MVCIEQFDIKGPPKQVSRQTRLPPDASQLDLPWNKKNKHHNPSFNDTNLYGSLNAVLWIRFILIRIRIRIRGSDSDDYGSRSADPVPMITDPDSDPRIRFRLLRIRIRILAESWQKIKVSKFLSSFWKEKFCGFPLSIKKRLKYSNPWTFRRNLAFSA